jgi:hypothetical protein
MMHCTKTKFDYVKEHINTSLLYAQSNPLQFHQSRKKLTLELILINLLKETA